MLLILRNPQIISNYFFAGGALRLTQYRKQNNGMKIGQIIRVLRKEHGVTQEQLALRIGSDSGNLSRIERGNQYPTELMLGRIAKAFNMRVSDLYRIGENYDETGSSSPRVQTQAAGFVPLLSWVQAGAWTEVADPESLDVKTWLPFPKRLGAHAFALEVRGDSMTAPAGTSYPDGAIIFVDPALAAMPGDDVVALLVDDNTATFKRLSQEPDGRRFLRPLNPQYSVVPINGNCRVCGVVVGFYKETRG